MKYILQFLYILIIYAVFGFFVGAVFYTLRQFHLHVGMTTSIVTTALIMVCGAFVPVYKNYKREESRDD